MERFRKCLNCCSVYQVDPKKPHKCFHATCPNCGEFQHVHHRCLIQPVAKEKETGKDPDMTRFIRLWNSPQGGSFNFRCPCKNLIRIQLIAIKSVMTCVLCVTYRRRAETKDRCYLYHNAISRARSKPTWKCRVRREKYFQSLDSRLPNKRYLVRSINDQMVLPTDIIHGKSKF